MHPFFVNTYAMKTPVGLLSGRSRHARRRRASMRRSAPGTRNQFTPSCYTHGHLDHAFGLKPFLEEGLQTADHRAELPAPFRRYALTHGYNEIINQRQFGSDKLRFPNDFDWPTLTFRDGMVQRMGDLRLRYHAAKGARPTIIATSGFPEEISVLRRSDRLAFAQLRQSAEGAALPNGRRRSNRWRRSTPNGVRPRSRGEGSRRRTSGADRDGAISSAHHRPGAAAAERRAIAGRDFPRGGFRSGPGGAAYLLEENTTIRNSSCAISSAAGAAGGTATPPISSGDAGARQAAEIAQPAGGVDALVRAQPRPPCEGRSRTRLPCRGMGGASFTRQSRDAGTEARRVRNARRGDEEPHGARHLSRRAERGAHGAGRGPRAARRTAVALGRPPHQIAFTWARNGRKRIVRKGTEGAPRGARLRICRRLAGQGRRFHDGLPAQRRRKWRGATPGRDRGSTGARAA